MFQDRIASRDARPRNRPQLEALEDRLTPSTLVGLNDRNQLVTFDSSAPGTILRTVSIRGLRVGEQVVGIDTRPADGKLYGVSNLNRLFTLNLNTGRLTQVGSTLSPGLGVGQ